MEHAVGYKVVDEGCFGGVCLWVNDHVVHNKSVGVVRFSRGRGQTHDVKLSDGLICIDYLVSACDLFDSVRGGSGDELVVMGGL